MQETHLLLQDTFKAKTQGK